MPKIVDDHDRARPVGDFALDVCCVQAQTMGLHIGENHRGPQVEGRHGRRPIGHALTDDFIADPHADAKHRGLQGCRPVAVAQRKRDPKPFGVFFLEFLGHVGARHGARPQDIECRLFIFFGNNRPLKHVIRRRLNGFWPAQNRKLFHRFLQRFPMGDCQKVNFSVKSSSTNSIMDLRVIVQCAQYRGQIVRRQRLCGLAS